MEYEFIKHLARRGVRIFTTSEAKKYAEEIGIRPDTMLDRLYRLNQKGLVERLMSGLYCLGPEFLSGIPIHEYEIATALVSPSAIAYLSAFSYHKLTDQMSSIIYVLATEEPKKNLRNTYTIRGIRYRIIRTKKENFFGIEKRWIGQVLIEVTDLERTLIDGIIKPKYCGGLREVLDAYSQAIDRIAIPKIISYAEKMSDSACKRLGWILSKLEIENSELEPLRKRVTSVFTKLDPSGPQSGTWNYDWYILENL